MDSEWPPGHEGAAGRMAMIDKAATCLSNLHLTAPRSFEQRPRRDRSELISSLWGFACSLTPGARDALSAVTGGAAASNDYVLAFRRNLAFPRAPEVPREVAHLRIQQYTRVRDEVARHVDASSCPELKAGEAWRPHSPKHARSLKGDARCMALAFIRWRQQFEGVDWMLNDRFKLRGGEIWNQSVFYASTGSSCDWLSYCIVSLVDAMDECLRAGQGAAEAIRRECALAGMELMCGTVVRIISEGRWPFLDRIVDEYGLRLSGVDFQRMASQAACELSRRLKTSGVEWDAALGRLEVEMPTQNASVT
jgi:hypothetical protein